MSMHPGGLSELAGTQVARRTDHGDTTRTDWRSRAQTRAGMRVSGVSSGGERGILGTAHDQNLPRRNHANRRPLR